MKSFFKIQILGILMAAMLACSACGQKLPDQPVQQQPLPEHDPGDIPDTTVNTKQGQTVIKPMTDGIRFEQKTNAGQYEAYGRLDYSMGNTRYSADDMLKNGFYLSFDVCAPEGVDGEKALLTVQSGKSGRVQSLKGAADGVFSVTERIISTDGETYEPVYITVDWDGEGTEQKALTYTVDLTNIDARLRMLFFGAWPMGQYYNSRTVIGFIEHGQKLVTEVDMYAFSPTSTSATYDMYELFDDPNDLNSFAPSDYASAKTVVEALENNSYDMVFVQTGRDYTVRDSGTRGVKNINAACKIAAMAGKNNDNVYISLVAPYGHQVNFSWLGGSINSHTEHVERINDEARQAYERIKSTGAVRESNVFVVYTGSVFEKYGSADRIKAELFEKDNGITGLKNTGNRATVAGSYLAAAATYAGTFGASPVGVLEAGAKGTAADASLFGEDEGVKKLLQQLGVTPAELMLTLQKKAHEAVLGTDSQTGQISAAVIFDDMGGTDTADIYAVPGDELAAPRQPSREGYVFTGWYRDRACTLPFYFERDTMPVEGLKLYAGWKQTEGIKYTVEHWVQNTDDDEYSLLRTDTNRTAGQGERVWAPLLRNEGTEYQAQNPDNIVSAEISAEVSTVLKVYYTRKEYCLSFDVENAPGQDVVPDSRYVRYGADVSEAGLAAEGYIFTGWTSSDCALSQDGSFVMPAADVTLNGGFVSAGQAPVITAADRDRVVYGKQVSQLQRDISLSGYAVRGISHYISEYAVYASRTAEKMVLEQYRLGKYGYGNYIALHIAAPDSIEAKNGEIVFEGDCDKTVIRGIDPEGADVVLRLSEQAQKISMSVDWDGTGTRYGKAQYTLDLRGLTLEKPRGLDELLCMAEAYHQRGDSVQYETYSMGRKSGGGGFGQYRRDINGIPEDGTVQNTLYLDCSGFIYALMKNTLGYTFNGNELTEGIIADPSERVYYYDIKGNETAAQKQAILEEYRSVLQPGDIMIYRHINQVDGHIMLYTGNGMMCHCSGAVYRNGVNLASETDYTYDAEDIGGVIKYESIDCLFGDTGRGLFTDKSRFAIIRPFDSEDIEVTEAAGIRYQSLQDVYIEKSISHFYGQTAALGDEVTVFISMTNNSDRTVELRIEGNYPLGTAAARGSAVNIVVIDPDDTKTVEYSVTITEKQEYYDFAASVNGMPINTHRVFFGGHLSKPQQELLEDIDIRQLKSTDGLGLIKEIYKDILGVNKGFGNCTSAADIIDRLFETDAASDRVMLTRDTGSVIYKMLAPQLYGGQRLYARTNAEHESRIKTLSTFSLMPGDVIVFAGEGYTPAAELTKNGAEVYIYLGKDVFVTVKDQKPVLFKADGVSWYGLTDWGSAKYVTDLIARLYGRGVFAVLRPSI